MTVIGDALTRAWGECLWTAPDLLKQRVEGTTIRVLAGPRLDEPPPRVVLVSIVANGWLRA